MKVISARNVNDAFILGVTMLKGCRDTRDSRAGPTIEWPAPVATVYQRPTERVLWSWVRAANPFFHFFESMWMLAGRDDVAFVEALLPRMAEYSDDGKRMQGAYGYRWRGHFYYDQLGYIIEELRNKPESRRAVLSMWDAQDLTDTASKDIPCNTHIYFKVRDEKLCMTVLNRSNDMLWGAYGANAVHMSFLQEYVANKLGRQVGVYTQVSDSFHVYTSGPGGKVWERVSGNTAYMVEDDYYRTAPQGQDLVCPYPLGADNPAWEPDMYRFFSMVDHGVLPSRSEFDTPWWRHVVVPYWHAFVLKDKVCLTDCAAEDWRIAGHRWFNQQRQKEVKL